MFAQVKKFSYIAFVVAVLASAPFIALAAATVDLPDGSKLDLGTACRSVT